MIQKWARSINCEPGFITESFESLAKEVQTSPEKRDCCLVIDAMAIRKQALWDAPKNKYNGFVDYGSGVQLEPTETLASEALVFELVGLRSCWKQPIGYFLIDKTTAAVQASLVNLAITMASNYGLKIWCVTCDGTTTNLAMFEKLGCSFGSSYDSITTKFKHPSTGDDVFAILDACHMLKLARNSLAFLGSIYGEYHEKIEWKFFQHLHHIQQRAGLKLANKLSTQHIEFQKHKMNVSLAAQTLSSSVADAIEYLNSIMKKPEFQGSEGTIKFIRILDRLFDILNSRNPHGKGFKQPLKLENMESWQEALESTATYLLSLTSTTGQPLINHRRKTFILGFVITIKSTIQMVKDMLTLPESPFRYVLTYKYSQDHIELLFSCIRAKGGWNNNPNVIQFKSALRSMILGNAVTASERANCKSLDVHENVIIPFFHIRKHVSPLVEDSTDTGNQIECEAERDRELSRMVNQIEFSQHSEFVLNILSYIAGLIVAKLLKRVRCPACVNSLIGSYETTAISEHDYCRPSNRDVYQTSMAFTQFVNKGGLKIPSKFVVNVVQYAEHIFKLYVSKETFDQMNVKDRLKTKMVMEICYYFGDTASNTLPPYHGHMSANETSSLRV